MHQIQFRSDPAVGAYSAPPDTLAGFKGTSSKFPCTWGEPIKHLYLEELAMKYDICAQKRQFEWFFKCKKRKNGSHFGGSGPDRFSLCDHNEIVDAMLQEEEGDEEEDEADA